MGCEEPKCDQFELSSCTLKLYWEPRAGRYTTCDTLPWPPPATLVSCTSTPRRAACPTFSVVSNPELEDWRRVLTTSRGHVMMAPAVPPTLKQN